MGKSIVIAQAFNYISFLVCIVPSQQFDPAEPGMVEVPMGGVESSTLDQRLRKSPFYPLDRIAGFEPIGLDPQQTVNLLLRNRAIRI
jgi:hypothetical protein